MFHGSPLTRSHGCPLCRNVPSPDARPGDSERAWVVSGHHVVATVTTVATIYAAGSSGTDPLTDFPSRPRPRQSGDASRTRGRRPPNATCTRPERDAPAASGCASPGRGTAPPPPAARGAVNASRGGDMVRLATFPAAVGHPRRAEEFLLDERAQGLREGHGIAARDVLQQQPLRLGRAKNTGVVCEPLPPPSRWTSSSSPSPPNGKRGRGCVVAASAGATEAEDRARSRVPLYAP